MCLLHRPHPHLSGNHAQRAARCVRDMTSQAPVIAAHPNSSVSCWTLVTCVQLTNRTVGPRGMILSTGAWQQTSRTHGAKKGVRSYSSFQPIPGQEPIHCVLCVYQHYDPDPSSMDKLDSWLVSGLNTFHPWHRIGPGLLEAKRRSGVSETARG